MGQVVRVGRCESVNGGARCRGLKGHAGPHWSARNPGDSLIGDKWIYGIRKTPQARAIFWPERDLGKNYAERMTGPLDLTPADEQAISDLLHRDV